MGIAAVGLGLQQHGGELLEGPFLGAGAIGELGKRSRCGWCFELTEQVRQLGARAAHAISWS
jgi:hypothetical protein